MALLRGRFFMSKSREERISLLELKCYVDALNILVASDHPPLRNDAVAYFFQYEGG